jgi:hypothetical protein
MSAAEWINTRGKFVLKRQLTRISDWFSYSVCPFGKKWPDICFGIPVAFLVFIFIDSVIVGSEVRIGADTTALLKKLNFNLLLAFVLNSLAYYFYTICFKDFFTKGWHEGVKKETVVIINYLLWSTVLVVNYFVIMNNI